MRVRGLLVVCSLLLAHTASARKFELLGTDETRIADEYIVTFCKDARDAFLDMKSNWKEHFSNEMSFTSGNYGMHFMMGKLTETELDLLESMPAVENIHHDTKVSLYDGNPGSQSPADPGLSRLDSRSGVDSSYNYLNDGAGVDIFILDTGVNTRHPDWAPGQARFWRDCVPNPCSMTDPGDPQGHGTHVAGLAASPTYGVAKAANVYSVRVLAADGAGTNQGIIRGLDAVVNTYRGGPQYSGNPIVINMSLGGGRSTALNEAVRIVWGEGITVVAAGGNDGNRFSACQLSPSGAPTVIAVGSSTVQDQVSSFSNQGSCLDIFAPGSNRRSLNAFLEPPTIVLSGTSMACPTVTGAVAQLLCANPNRTPNTIEALLRSASTVNALSGVAADTGNRLLYVQADAFAGEVAPVDPVDDQTTNTTVQATPANTDAFVCASTVPDDQQDLREADGVMFDITVDPEVRSNGQAVFLESLTLFSEDPVINGVVGVFRTADFQSYVGQETDPTAWIAAGAGNGAIQVNSQPGFGAQQIEVYLNPGWELIAGQAQGIYVTFATDGDEMFLREPDDGNATISDDFITISAGYEVRFPLETNVDDDEPRKFTGFVCYTVTNDPALDLGNNDAGEPDVLLTDDETCLVSQQPDSTMAYNGVMFDLAVDEPIEDPGLDVLFDTASVFATATISSGVAEIWRTANRESYVGQENNRDDWVLVARLTGMEVAVENLEAAQQTEVNIGDSLAYGLRADGEPEGFYVTFRNDLMRYYTGGSESDVIAQNDRVTMTGGVGVVYPFGQTFTPRQFAGALCTRVGVAAAAPPQLLAAARASILVAVLASALVAMFN